MGTQKHSHTDIGVTQTDLSTSYFSKVAMWLEIFNCLTLLRLIDSIGFTDDLRLTF